MELMREISSDTYRVQEDMMRGKDAPYFNEVPPPYNNAQQQYNTTQPNTIMRNHSITPHNITRYLSTTHHEEIEMDTKVEDDVDEYLEEAEVQ
jgi:hypothetical protein